MPTRSPLVVLLLAAVVHAAPPTTGPSTTGPATVPSTRPLSDRRAELVKEHAALRRRTAAPVSAFFSVGVEDGFLAVRPVAGQPDDDDSTVDFVGWPGFAELRTVPALSLTHDALSDNDTVETITQLFAFSGHVQVSRDRETPTRVTSVQLIQTRQAGGGDPVHLIITDKPGDNPPAPGEPAFARPILLDAATFADLVRDHPTVAREYLLPILKDLGGASVVAGSDPARAWQALGPLVPPDVALGRRIDALLKRLDADDFADRAKAEDELMALGVAGAVELRRLDLGTLPPDPRSVAEDALRRAEPLPPARAAALRTDVPFLLDTLRLDDPRLNAAAAKQLATVTGRPLDLPPGLPAAERDRRIDAYMSETKTVERPATRPSAP